jgi:membrane dipeptidase
VVATKEALDRAQEAPELGICKAEIGDNVIAVDMHSHPLLDTYLPRSELSGQGAFALPPDRRLSVDALTRGRVGVVVSSVYPFLSRARGTAYLARCRDILDFVEAYLGKQDGRTSLVRTPDDIKHALGQGRISFIHAVEGGHVLEGRLDNLERLYAWGVRSLTLTHFMSNDVAASAFDPRRQLAQQSGLTPLGRQVVAEMNALGMIIDLAHCSERAFWQTLELTRDPILVSHTGIRHYVPWEICMSDRQVKAVADNGGVIGIIFSSLWLKRFGLGGEADLVENILYVCRLVGADYVGLGSDLNGTPIVRGMKDAGDFRHVEAALEKRGLSPDDVAKVMGGNFLRLFADVARV